MKEKRAAEEAARAAAPQLTPEELAESAHLGNIHQSMGELLAELEAKAAIPLDEDSEEESAANDRAGALPRSSGGGAETERITSDELEQVHCKAREALAIARRAQEVLGFDVEPSVQLQVVGGGLAKRAEFEAAELTANAALRAARTLGPTQPATDGEEAQADIASIKLQACEALAAALVVDGGSASNELDDMKTRARAALHVAFSESEDMSCVPPSSASVFDGTLWGTQTLRENAQAALLSALSGDAMAEDELEQARDKARHALILALSPRDVPNATEELEKAKERARAALNVALENTGADAEDVDLEHMKAKAQQALISVLSDGAHAATPPAINDTTSLSDRGLLRAVLEDAGAEPSDSAVANEEELEQAKEKARGALFACLGDADGGEPEVQELSIEAEAAESELAAAKGEARKALLMAFEEAVDAEPACIDLDLAKTEARDALIMAFGNVDAMQPGLDEPGSDAESDSCELEEMKARARQSLLAAFEDPGEKALEDNLDAAKAAAEINLREPSKGSVLTTFSASATASATDDADTVALPASKAVTREALLSGLQDTASSFRDVKQSMSACNAGLKADVAEMHETLARLASERDKLRERVQRGGPDAG